MKWGSKKELIVGAAALAAVANANTSLTAEDRKALLNSTGGGCELARSGVSSDSTRLSVKVVGLVERAADGTPVGETAVESHVMTEDEDWGVEDMTFTVAGPTDLYYQGLKARNVNLTANIFQDSSSSDATLAIQSYVFQEDGVITAGGESTVVSNGTLKLSFAVTDWPFCSDTASSGSYKYCMNSDSSALETGTFLDLSFKVVGPGQRGSNKKGPSKGGLTEKVEEKYAEDGDGEDFDEWVGGGGMNGGISGGLSGGNGTHVGGGGSGGSGGMEGGSGGFGGSDGGQEGTQQQGTQQSGGAFPEDGQNRNRNRNRRLAGGDRPEGYDFSGDDNSTGYKSLLDVSKYFWSTDFGWQVLPAGGPNHTDASDHSNSIFTVRMNASSGTMLYDPTASIVATSVTESSADGSTSAGFVPSPTVAVMLLSLLLAAVPLFF